MNIEFNRNKISFPLLYLIGWVLLYCLPRRFYNVGGDNGYEGWLLFIIMFIILPIILYKALLSNKIKAEIAKCIALGSIFFAIPFILIIDKEETAELDSFKTETIGIVSKAWTVKRKHRSPVWNIQASYNVNGKSYRSSSKDDKDKTLALGDTVTIIYSSKTPENCDIKELIEFYNKNEEIVFEENKCDEQQLKLVMERISNNSEDINVKDGFILLENNCKTNIEFSQIQNELIFRTLELKPSIFVDLIENQKFKEFVLLNFISNIENPIHDEIDLTRIISKVKSIEQNETTKKILLALDAANEK